MNEIVVSLESVCKVFDGAGRVRALDGVGLDVPRGQRLSVMGPSGSGKSTLLNIVCGLDVPTSGRVLINGSDLAAMNDDDRTRLRREQIGMIFQTFNLMPTLSGVENVALPLRLCGMSGSDAAGRAAAMLERVGLSSRGTHRPDEMSGGERQRVAIARALIFDPPLLLADEPTGNLDPAAAAQVFELFLQLRERSGTTTVLVTHNPDLARRCAKILRLEEGAVRPVTLDSA